MTGAWQHGMKIMTVGQAEHDCVISLYRGHCEVVQLCEQRFSWAAWWLHQSISRTCPPPGQIHTAFLPSGIWWYCQRPYLRSLILHTKYVLSYSGSSHHILRQSISFRRKMCSALQNILDIPTKPRPLCSSFHAPPYSQILYLQHNFWQSYLCGYVIYSSADTHCQQCASAEE